MFLLVYMAGHKWRASTSASLQYTPLHTRVLKQVVIARLNLFKAGLTGAPI